jgi:hypothetical protein
VALEPLEVVPALVVDVVETRALVTGEVGAELLVKNAWSTAMALEPLEVVPAPVVDIVETRALVTGVFGAELLMTMPLCVPVIDPVIVSVAVSDHVPMVRNVALKVWTPASVAVYL